MDKILYEYLNADNYKLAAVILAHEAPTEIAATLSALPQKHLLGASLGVACFGKLMLVDNLIFGYKGYTVFTCMVVSIALLCTVVIAKMVGCMLPMLAKKIKLDPAVVASPFITTIVDALSLILYCGLAIAMLG